MQVFLSIRQNSEHLVHKPAFVQKEVLMQTETTKCSLQGFMVWSVAPTAKVADPFAPFDTLEGTLTFRSVVTLSRSKLLGSMFFRLF